jgi:hypothetical protein
MNKLFRLSFFCFAAAFVFSGCSKEENKLYFESGTPPVLTAEDTSDIVLIRDNAAQNAVTFDWTNPNYQFNTGVSSQDVTYTLQVDTLGANFTSPTMQELSISKDLSVTYTVQQLNSILTKLDVKEDIPHETEFRIVSSLANSVKQTSNSISITITPYLDVAVPIPPTDELYITGSAMPSDWTNNPPETQKCEQVSKTEYDIVVHLKPGLQYKFLSTLNNWQPQYGIVSATSPNPKSGGDIGYNFGLPGQKDPDSFPTPDVEGDYKVDLNFKTGKYTVTKQ